MDSRKGRAYDWKSWIQVTIFVATGAASVTVSAQKAEGQYNAAAQHLEDAKKCTSSAVDKYAVSSLFVSPKEIIQVAFWKCSAEWDVVADYITVAGGYKKGTKDYTLKYAKNSSTLFSSIETEMMIRIFDARAEHNGTRPAQGVPN